MSTFIDDLVAALGEEAQAHHARYLDLARRAGEMKHPQMAKFFRAVVAAETARISLYRHCLEECQTKTWDYFICPRCGVAVAAAAPEQCPLCDTPGIQFERIS